MRVSSKNDLRPHLSCEPVVVREDNRLGARPHAQLVEDVRDVVANRLVADRQSFGNLRVAEALGNERQDFALASRECGKGGILASRRYLRYAMNSSRLAETGPRWFVLEQDVVSGVELRRTARPGCRTPARPLRQGDSGVHRVRAGSASARRPAAADRRRQSPIGLNNVSGHR